MKKSVRSFLNLALLASSVLLAGCASSKVSQSENQASDKTVVQVESGKLRGEVTQNGFAENGKGIPLLIGSNLNEWTSVPVLQNADAQKARLENLTESEILEEAKKTYGDKAAKVAPEYKW